VDQDLIKQLTLRVDQLLAAYRQLQQECTSLRQEKDAWQLERKQVLIEIDTILAKLERV